MALFWGFLKVQEPLQTHLLSPTEVVFWGFLKVQEPLQTHLLSPTEMCTQGIPEGTETTASTAETSLSPTEACILEVS
jgi:hypothetical protein